MSGITLQNIFVAAWQAYIVEGKPSGREGVQFKVCRYLTSAGNRCAIGHALPDGCEALNSDASFESLPMDFPGLFAPDVELLSANYRRKFQDRMHDMILDENGSFPADLKERYIQIAKDFELTVPDVPEGWDRV